MHKIVYKVRKVDSGESRKSLITNTFSTLRIIKPDLKFTLSQQELKYSISGYYSVSIACSGRFRTSINKHPVHIPEEFPLYRTGCEFWLSDQDDVSEGFLPTCPEATAGSRRNEVSHNGHLDDPQASCCPIRATCYRAGNFSASFQLYIYI